MTAFMACGHAKFTDEVGVCMAAEKMAKAMAKGDPELVGVMQKSLRGKLQEFKESLPGRL